MNVVLETHPLVYPEWVGAFRREAAIRRAVILSGNVADRFFDPEKRELVALSELLTRILAGDQALAPSLLGLWDPADGLRFADARHRRRFEELMRRPAGTARAAQATAYDVGAAAAPASMPAGGLYPNPVEFFSALRTVFADPRERPVFLVDWANMLVTQSSNPDGPERQWLLHLSKLIAGEPVLTVTSDQLRDPGGLLVILTPCLGSIPTSLYQNQPQVKLLSVPLPGRPERRSFFLRTMDDLRCRRPDPPPGTLAGAAGGFAEPLADQFADATDRMTTCDLLQLVGLSKTTPGELTVPKLITLYRVGTQNSPWEQLSEDRVRQAETILKKRVVGQDAAVRHVEAMIVRAYLGLAGLQHSDKPGKPKGTLFFVGPTGVGKTELAKALAEFLFGDESACLRFDMSEYNHEHSDQRLLGAPPGYVGYEAGGQLTNAVREKPFSVILFDEIEKAHDRILDKFLPILEDGRLTDGRGETVYFSETVIIFTSNIGAATMPATGGIDEIRRHFVREVEAHFKQKLGRPELLNRYGYNIVVFDPIVDGGFRRAILERKVAPLCTVIKEKFGVELKLADAVFDHYVKQARADHGGRGLANALERDLINPLAHYMFQHKHQLKKGRVLNVTVDDGAVAITLAEEARHD